MINKLIQVSVSATTLRTLIFTTGHFFIDIVVISTVTGAPIGLAGLASIIGPIINGMWFWTIDRLWSQAHANDELQHMHG